MQIYFTHNTKNQTPEKKQNSEVGSWLSLIYFGNWNFFRLYQNANLGFNNYHFFQIFQNYHRKILAFFFSSRNFYWCYASHICFLTTLWNFYLSNLWTWNFSVLKFLFEIKVTLIMQEYTFRPDHSYDW